MSKHESISTSGAPTITFAVEGDTIRAELAGAKLYAEAASDERADLRVTDATGFVLADLVVNRRAERNLTENVMDIGSALLWSHWRFVESAKGEAHAPDVESWKAKRDEAVAACLAEFGLDLGAAPTEGR